MTTFSPCEEQNLSLIAETVGGRFLTLTVDQVAKVFGTSAGAVHQKIRRGHLGFDSITVHGRPLFAVLSVAQFLCGAVVVNPVNVKMPKSTPRSVRSSSDLRARLLALRADIQRRGDALRALDKTDKSGQFKNAVHVHADVCTLVVSAVDRAHLRNLAGGG
jgi:hypothetical protein